MDFWDTAATVRELSVHPFHPTHPLYVLPGDRSVRFNPYTLFWGIFERIAGLGIFSTMAIAGIVNYLLFAIALFLFVSDKFKNRSLPLFTFVIMLWVWGTGYDFANAYHLRMFLLTLPYIGSFAFALTLLALYFLNRFCAISQKQDLLLYAVLSMMVFITHPITGLFCYVAAFALLLEGKNWKRLLMLQIIPLVALGTSMIWPYFSYADLFTKNTVMPEVKSPLFENQLSSLGFALLGLPILIFYIKRKEQLFMVFGFLFCAFIYFFSYFAQIPIGSRFILYSAFFLHLSLSLLILGSKNLSSPLRVAVLLLIFAVPGVYRFHEMQNQINFDQGLAIRSPIRPYLFLDNSLSNGDVVLTSNWREGFPIPAISGARIVEPRVSSTLLMQKEASQRKIDVQSFFQSSLTHEERILMLREYLVTHILINRKDESKWEPSFLKDLNSFGTEVARNRSIVLYKIIF